jgi:hypothetical protein
MAAMERLNCEEEQGKPDQCVIVSLDIGQLSLLVKIAEAERYMTVEQIKVEGSLWYPLSQELKKALTRRQQVNGDEVEEQRDDRYHSNVMPGPIVSTDGKTVLEYQNVIGIVDPNGDVIGTFHRDAHREATIAVSALNTWS